MNVSEERLISGDLYEQRRCIIEETIALQRRKLEEELMGRKSLGEIQVTICIRTVGEAY